MKSILSVLVFWALIASNALAEVIPNSLFSNHAVLQRGVPIPIWGTATKDEHITIEFAGQKAQVTAQDGHWQVDLKPVAAGGPYVLILKGSNTVVVQDIWMGDVWVCSGQSNMERHLGLQPGQKPIVNWQQEVAAANYPHIRQYYVPKRPSDVPMADADGQWSVCSPETAPDFSAVGYFFARDLYKKIHVPIGLLFTSWGGTVAEAWTSAESLMTMDDFKAAVQQVQQRAHRPKKPGEFETRLAAWYQKYDPGSAEGKSWSREDLSDRDWPTMDLPGNWEGKGLPNFDGIVWFRKVVDLPAHWAGKKAELNLGPIDDQDTTWVNGSLIGGQQNWQFNRNYIIPAGVLKAGHNLIAIRVLDTAGPGGIYGQPKQMSLRVPSLGANAKIALAGPWSYHVGVALHNAPNVPRRPGSMPNVTTVLYNGMIAPLLPARIKGVIWYQGENNNDRARQYRRLFPLLIQDWRQHWLEGNFPFLFVQIAPYQGMSPEIREAQFLTLSKSPNTAMAVITDAGDANDIHPAHKQPVGARLALAARALAYGEHIEYSGPLYQSMTVKDHSIVLTFTHTDTGLMSQGGDLKGFVIAGADKHFVPAQARIEGNTVVVSSDKVPQPVAARYGWSNVPNVNLYNKEGLPASPFRTDVD